MLKDKKGAALEMGIFFMFTVFALCSIMTTVSFSMWSNDKIMTNRANSAFYADQIGEYFVQSVQDEEPFTADVTSAADTAETQEKGGWIPYGDYGIRVDNEGNRYTLRVANWTTVKDNGDADLALIVTVEENADGEYRIMNWSDQENNYKDPVTETPEVDVKKGTPNWKWNTRWLWMFLWRFFRRSSDRVIHRFGRH